MKATCTCIEKFRDSNGKIIGYRLQDDSGRCLDIEAEQLKLAIFSNQLEVSNLKLTSDSRLIEKKKRYSVDPVLFDSLNKIITNDANNSNHVTLNDKLAITGALMEKYKFSIGYIQIKEVDKDHSFIDFSCGRLIYRLDNNTLALLGPQLVRVDGELTANYNKFDYMLSSFKGEELSNEKVVDILQKLGENHSEVNYSNLSYVITRYIKLVIKNIESIGLLGIRDEFDPLGRYKKCIDYLEYDKYVSLSGIDYIVYDKREEDYVPGKGYNQPGVICVISYVFANSNPYTFSIQQNKNSVNPVLRKIDINHDQPLEKETLNDLYKFLIVNIANAVRAYENNSNKLKLRVNKNRDNNGNNGGIKVIRVEF